MAIASLAYRLRALSKAVLATAMAFGIALACAEDPLSGVAPGALSPATNTISPAPNASLIDQPADFLPVAEAYQFSASLAEGNRLQVDWSIAPGYYLYQERFKVSLPDGAALALEFEPGERRYDDYYQKELTVYYAQTRVTTTLPATTGTLTLKLESQGCADAGLCYPPRSQFVVVDTAAATAIEVPPPATSKTGQNGDRATSLPLYLIFAFALFGGLILNLMPCVFPVLSIKALSLASAGLSVHNRHYHGIAYTAGVITTFALVAMALTLLRASGQALGWGFQLQSPTFITALVYLFFLMGLSFSGFFDAGARLMNLGQSRIQGHGLRQSFLTGVLACVVASPCSAPFMGTALGAALTQTTPVTLLIFVFLGLGMALPFLLLSWVPALVALLPKPGPWMASFKEFLAFPLYFTCAWLLWVLGRQTSADSVILILCGLVLIAFTLWVLKKPGRWRQLTAAIALIVCLLVTQHGLNPGSTEQSWEPYSSQRLDTLLDNRQAVFINLTAAWCITCLSNERLALSSETFEDALRQYNVTYLKGDWTNTNPEITALLNRHGRSGVPLYLFYPAGQRTPVILPQLLNEQRVIDTLSGKK